VDIVKHRLPQPREISPGQTSPPPHVGGYEKFLRAFAPLQLCVKMVSCRRND
jgi:hypothetical protein